MHSGVISFFFQILLAVDLAVDCKDTQADLWSRISRDEYMAYAVKECYCSIEKILYSLVDNEGRLWYELYCHILLHILLCWIFLVREGIHIKSIYKDNESRGLYLWEFLKLLRVVRK